MKLIELNIRNFKGIKHFDLTPGGESIDIHGDNATGKTTVYDAFLWLLFNKDSSGRTSFEVKPLDDAGNCTLGGAAVEVCAVIEQGGRRVRLRKSYAENWVKKRGEAQAELAGHTTEYFVDELPLSMREFKARVDEIMPEDTFRLLTDVRYFNTILSWQERRKKLFGLCGEPSDDEIYRANPELAALREAAGSMPIADYKVVLGRSLAKLRDTLKILPQRLDEAQRALTPEVDVAAVQASKAALETQLQEYTDLLSASASSRRAELESELRRIDTEIAALDAENRAFRARQQAEIDTTVMRRRAEIDQIKATLAASENEAALADRSIERAEREIKLLSDDADRLRAEWYKADGLVFDVEVCPTCGQRLPDADIAASREEFDRHKAARLADIEERGNRISEDIARLRDGISSMQGKRVVLRKDAERLSEDLKAAQDAQPAGAVQDMPEYADKLTELRTQRDATEAELSQIAQGERSVRYAITAKIDDVKRRLAEAGEMLYRDAANRRTRERIAELHAQRDDAARELERAEVLLNLCDAYTVAKVELIEDRVNAAFAVVRWKLFDRQINGGLADTCVCTVDGVPYGDLNNAMKINAGLDIVNAFSKQMGVTAPLFIDNAESVVSLLPTAAQVVRLVVDGSAPAMVVYGAKENREVA